MKETFTTGTGQKITNVHSKKECEGYHCPIHNPSDHHMMEWPTHWRDDRRLLERICPCGVGHPDPDHLARTERIWGETRARAEAVHGCCGCCQKEHPE
jgi:hypothetical protein